MRAGSLFAGIGGIDLALESLGIETAWQVEIDPWCRGLLARRFPHARQYDDVTRTDWSTIEPVDIITGGFPCQPHSVAGSRKGTDDDRWLWCDMARAVDVLRPRYVLVENVPGLLTSDGDPVADSYTRGGTVGGGTRRPVRGGAFGAVLADLAALGYDAAWDVLGASELGAPHRRDRLWLVAAHAGSWGRDGRSPSPSGHFGHRDHAIGREGDDWASGSCDSSVAAHADRDKLRAQPLAVRGGDDPRVARADGTRRRARTLGGADTYADRNGRQKLAQRRAEAGREVQRGRDADGLGVAARIGVDAHTDRERLQADGQRRAGSNRQGVEAELGRAFLAGDGGSGVEVDADYDPRDARRAWLHGPPVAPLRRVDDGIPARLDRPRLKGLGNAVVPCVAACAFAGLVARLESTQ